MKHHQIKHVAAIMMIAVLISVAPVFAISTDTDSKARTITPSTFVDISKKALPAVVSINVKKTVTSGVQFGRQQNEDLREFFEKRGGGGPFGEDSPLFPFFFPFGQQPEQQPREFEIPASGSGVIFRPDGYVITNYHVIANADEGQISIHLADDTVFDGDEVKVVGEDSFTDIAVLKIETDRELAYLNFADSDKLEIGEWVLALGSPLELKGSVSQGIISAKHRTIGKAVLEDHIQTTAVINPGNSGGPLVNMDGRIVGINTAIASNTGRWQGVGFSIPSKVVRNVAESIIEKGRASRGWLGIYMADLNQGILKTYDLEDVQGVMVSRVVEDSPAEKAGIKAYDIVSSVNGENVSNRLELLQKIASKAAGEEVTLGIYRLEEDEAEEMEIKVTLGERPSDAALEGKQEPQQKEDKPGEFNNMGIIFGEKIEDQDGLPIAEIKPDSPAAKAGLQSGDILLEVNRKKINSTEDFRKALKEAPKKRDHIVMYQRGSEILFSTIERQ